jgi:hypothetical protein
LYSVSLPTFPSHSFPTLNNLGCLIISLPAHKRSNMSSTTTARNWGPGIHLLPDATGTVPFEYKWHSDPQTEPEKLATELLDLTPDVSCSVPFDVGDRLRTASGQAGTWAATSKSNTELAIAVQSEITRVIERHDLIFNQLTDDQRELLYNDGRSSM